MHPKRVAYVLSRFPLLSETFILREMLALERQGWEIDLYAIQHERAAVRHPEALRLEGRAAFFDFASARTLAANLRLLARSPGLYGRLLARTALGNRGSRDFLLKGLAVFPGAVELAERMRRRGVRHIHAHYGTHPALVAMLAAELLDIGFSFTVHAHDLFVDTTMLAEKVRRARLVVTISEYNRDVIRQLAGPSADGKIGIVRYGLDLEQYRFRDASPTLPLSSSPTLRLLTVGSLQEYKGHERLIGACALLRDAAPELTFVCNIVGEGKLRPTLQALIAELQLQQHVRLLGALDQHAVREQLERADVFVLPSVVARDGQVEGLPNVLIEAMAVGIPVVASRLVGIPELVRHGETGLLVPAGNPVALRDAIFDCQRDPAAATERARRGRALVEREHEQERNAAQLGGLFACLLSAAGGRGPGSGDAASPPLSSSASGRRPPTAEVR